MVKIVNRILERVNKNPQVASVAILVIGALVFSGVAINQVFLGNQKSLKNASVEVIKSESKVAGVNIENESTETPSVSISSTSTPKPTKKATSTPTPRPTSQPEVKSDNATNQSEDHEPPTTYITITPITPTPTQVESEPETSGYCEINADKTSGSVPLTVNFTYTYVAIYTKADNWVTGIQWDFDGDGNWDTEMGNEQTNIRPTHNYVAGNYTARMRIQLKSGYTTDVCTKEIKAL